VDTPDLKVAAVDFLAGSMVTVHSSPLNLLGRSSSTDDDHNSSKIYYGAKPRLAQFVVHHESTKSPTA